MEDNDQDYEATVRAFRRAGLRNRLVRCTDGDDALDYLNGRGVHSGAERQSPGVILLDLNMPGTDGREVLKEVKSDEKLRSIPVIVLTTSDDRGDIDECYQLGANSYIQKPVDVPGFFHAIQLLRNYWLEVVILPRRDV